jgi:hypothetical protein
MTTKGTADIKRTGYSYSKNYFFSFILATKIVGVLNSILTFCFVKKLTYLFGEKHFLAKDAMFIFWFLNPARTTRLF